MTLLSKDKILAADDLSFEDVDVPEWGGTVRVKALTGKERESFDKSILHKTAAGDFEPDITDMRVKLLVRALIDEDGKPLFTVKDIEALSGKSFKVLDRIYDVAARLNAVSKADVDELAKNSGGAQNGDSGSD